ncbi:MAG TPA: hypothetical protein VN278_04965 [Methanosarcina sp.]|nr:hypothetical protein [Methanosarcina sp.]
MMTRSTGTRTVAAFLGLLLCLVCMSPAFAQSGGETAIDVGNNDTNVTLDNVTVHEISPNGYSTSLTAGFSEQISVSFKNNAEEALDINPKVVTIPNIVNKMDESWITISPANTTVAPGEAKIFTVTLNVPKDTETGFYQSRIAFTDDIRQNTQGDGEPQYVNILNLDASVQGAPKIQVETNYISDTLEAGKVHEYTMKIKNVAKNDVNIAPKVGGYNYYPGYAQAFTDDAINISAPSVIKAGETVNMTIRVNVPENATGMYNSYIQMNSDGQTNDVYSTQINLNFNVWKPPTAPFVKTFSTKTAGKIKIEISTNTYQNVPMLRSSPERPDPSFELGLKYNSSPVDINLKNVTKSGSVSVGGNSFPLPWESKNGITYQNYNSRYVETYEIPGAIGDWELTILPKNTESFDYSIVLESSE